MADEFLSLRWKDHASELAKFCTTFLDDKYLVDCTISAEGQFLKAHRIILSACSPYFHMLFNDETEKHPIVVFFDASFETLKAVIDFVYCGEAQIPQGNFKAFLELAQALQIKGLNACTGMNDNQDNCEVQVPVGKLENGNDGLSQQCLHLSGGHADAQTNSSVSVDGCSDSWENMQAAAVVPPLPGQQINIECDELSREREITVKSESLFCEFLEPKQELLDDVKSGEQKLLESLTSELEKETAPVFGQRDLYQLSSCGESSGARVKSASTMSPLQQLGAQQRLQEKQQQQQVFQLSDEVPRGPNVDDQPQPLLPVILVPKKEQPSDTESEPMDDNDVVQENSTDTDKEAAPMFGEENVNRSTRTVGPPAALERGRQRGTQEYRHRRSANKCSYCEKTFSVSSHLQIHLRIHTGERPFKCNECDASFRQSNNLICHKRTHTGERPFKCSVCDATFTQSSALRIHKRIHTGERPFKCSECDATFTHFSSLKNHKITHTGERPFKCSVCDATFTQSSSLKAHKPIHTGERRFKCNECDASFRQSHGLIYHKRTHTGERPFKCSVCDATFTQSSSLKTHKRIHTGERPFKCSECDATFTRSPILKTHKLTHTGERRFVCNACSKRFKTKVALLNHLLRLHPSLCE